MEQRQKVAASGWLRWRNSHRLGQVGAWSSILSKCEKWVAEVNCFLWLHLGETWKQLPEAPMKIPSMGLFDVLMPWWGSDYTDCIFLSHGDHRPFDSSSLKKQKSSKHPNTSIFYQHCLCMWWNPFLQTWPAQGTHKWKHVVSAQGYHSAVQTCLDHSRMLWQLGLEWVAWTTQSLPMSFLVPLIFLSKGMKHMVSFIWKISKQLGVGISFSNIC